MNLQEFRETLKEWRINRWRISDEQVAAWRRLDRHCPKEIATDCAMNAAAFLGIIDRPTAKKIARVLNVKQSGSSFEQEAQPYMYEAILRNERMITQHELKILQFDPSVIAQLVHEIGPGHATAIELGWPLEARGLVRGHMLVLAVSAGGIPVLLDPQQEDMFVGADIDEEIIRRGYHDMRIYMRRIRHKNPLHETEYQVRKPRSYGPPTKKRRLTHLPLDRFFYAEREVSPAQDRVPSPQHRVPSPMTSPGSSPESSHPHPKPLPAKKVTRRTVKSVLARINAQKERNGQAKAQSDELEEGEEPDYPRDVSPAYQPSYPEEAAPGAADAATSDSPHYDPTAGEEQPTAPSPRKSTRGKKKKGGKRRRTCKN